MLTPIEINYGLFHIALDDALEGKSDRIAFKLLGLESKEGHSFPVEMRFPVKPCLESQY